jgi:LmbE family N-acetylglucosaminyl deacetylase
VTVLVISPHLDDAVLSAGGTIAAAIAAGDRVVIASVYTAGPPLADIAPAMRKFADYATRRAEDLAACSSLGAEVHRLDQIERAFRRPYLTGWSFFDTRAGFATQARVRDALEPLAALDPARVLVPFGIGNHVDHVEAQLAAIDFVIAHGWLARTWFYEDFYALSRTMRRAHPVAARHTWTARRSPLLRARRLAVILRTIAAARRGPALDALWPDALRTAAWRLHRSDIRAFERAKLDAIAHYPSQTTAFGGMPAVARALRTYHELFGGAEPFWLPVTAAATSR